MDTHHQSALQQLSEMTVGVDICKHRIVLAVNAILAACQAPRQQWACRTIGTDLKHCTDQCDAPTVFHGAVHDLTA